MARLRHTAVTRSDYSKGVAHLFVIARGALETDNLIDQLKLAGHEVDQLESAIPALELILRSPPDLVIVDAELSDMSGSELIRTVRATTSIRRLPIIMTSTSASEIDRVVAFEVGADDYVVKPFSVREVVLRVRAVLRRRRPARAIPTSAVRVGVLEIDPATQRATVEGVEVELSGKELRLLLALHRERGRVRTRSELLSEVWGSRDSVSNRTVDACMKRLRAKLGPAAACLQTVRGVGYRLVTTEEAGP